MFTVDDVGIEEEALYKKMPFQGFIEQRDKFLLESGLYKEWQSIYSKYVKLAQDGDLEALKRALFFAWYQLAEPCWLSGIKELPDKETLVVVNVLEKLLEQGIKDTELEFMLPYYMSVCEYYLERFYPLPNIVEASSNNTSVTRSGVRSVRWNNRGKMGDYWSGGA